MNGIHEKLKWFNLKKNKCPRCGKDWAFDLTVVDGILVHACGFRISERKYKQIVSGMVTADIEKEIENEQD